MLRSVLASFVLLFALCDRTPAQAPHAVVHVPAQAPHAVVQAPHVRVELAVDFDSIPPGGAARIGVHFSPQPGWHVYWKNPGDSGTAPKIEWRLPHRLRADELMWPAPSRIRVGPLANYGYEHDAWLVAPLHVEPSANESTVVVGANIRWLVCQETCIPGRASLETPLVIARGAARPNALFSEFDAARSQVPIAWPSHLRVWATEAANAITLHVRHDSIGDADESKRRSHAPQRVEFFPVAAEIVQAAAPQLLHLEPDGYSLRLVKADNAPSHADLTGVLEVDARFYDIHPRLEVAPAQVGVEARSHDPVSHLGVFSAVFLAFLGGLLLNVMPCVFPVLSIKALNVAKQLGESKRETRAQALLYTAGIVVCFLAFATALLAVRATGRSLGWGFQLQSPPFVALLAMLLFLMALNLLGTFEISSRFAGLGQEWTTRRDWLGSFATGVLATVVATPCTAPFMGTALGFALQQSAPVVFVIFVSLGLGLAFPFVVLSYTPTLVRAMPRPGRWMETLKHWLAFPLLGTVIWLLWVFAHQRTVDALAILLTGILILALAAHTWGRFMGLASRVAATLLFVGACWVAWHAATRAEVKNETIAFEPYTPEAVDRALAERKPVFIDFTADWCITCKANERVALRSERVLAEFKRRQVRLFVADWTSEDPVITTALTRYGRGGVPLYVLYTGRDRDPPQLLPQLLTPDLVLSRLRTIPPMPKETDR